jgi:cytoskeleton protein RodZ
MTLGQLFKNKRNELGRSLEQISASTRIHIKTLTALENDEYAELPARTFTRGFIITYCKALRLDSNEVLKNYHDFLDSKFSERSARDKGHQGYVFEGKELEQNKRWMVIGATLAVFFAISVLLIFKPQNSHRKEKHKEFVEEASPAPGTNDEDATDTEVAAPNLIAAIPSITASPHLATSATPIASVVPAVAVVAITSPSPTASPSATATPAPVAVRYPKRRQAQQGR